MSIAQQKPPPRLVHAEQISLASHAPPVPCQIFRGTLFLRQRNKLQSHGVDDERRENDESAELTLARSTTERLRAEVTRLRHQLSTDATAAAVIAAEAGGDHPHRQGGDCRFDTSGRGKDWSAGAAAAQTPRGILKNGEGRAEDEEKDEDLAAEKEALLDYVQVG